MNFRVFIFSDDEDDTRSGTYQLLPWGIEIFGRQFGEWLWVGRV